MKKVIYVVDAQRDFMNQDGTLYVPDSENIKKNIKSVMTLSYQNDVLMLGSMDTHAVDDEEFNSFPKHCVIGTTGQDIISEVVVHNDALIYTVPNNGNGIDMYIVDNSWQIFFEKQTIDIWDKTKGQPDNLETVLRYEDVATVYIIGVATNLCVLAAVKGFIKRKYKVTVIEDCIKGLYISDDNNEESAKKEMIDLGVRFINSCDYENEIK